MTTINGFAEPLIDFWAELEDTIHPQDYSVLNRHPRKHTLNTDYPPPAFIGDIRRARVFVLLANGGYDDKRTPEEFAQSGSAEAYRDRLRNPVPCDSNTHPYYLQGTELRKWLEEGQAAVVNAMAYRSYKISKERENWAIAEELPSVQFHRNWLRSHLKPAIGETGVMVIVHRPGLWNLGLHSREAAGFEGNESILFTPNPVSKYLAKSVIELAGEFLDDRRAFQPRAAD
jgi:hypothetical protein